MAAKLWSAVAVVALAGVAAFSYNQTQNLDGHVRMRDARVHNPGHNPGHDHGHDHGHHHDSLDSVSDAMESAPINACALLKDEEVSEIVGAMVSPGQRRDDGEVGNKGDYAPPGTYSSTCFWTFHVDAAAKDDPNLPMGGRRFAILNAMVWPQGGGYAAQFLQSFRDAFKHEIIPSDPVAVDIADEALWWGDGVAARKGDRSFGISVYLQNGDKETQRKMEESLARKIAERI